MFDGHHNCAHTKYNTQDPGREREKVKERERREKEREREKRRREREERRREEKKEREIEKDWAKEQRGDNWPSHLSLSLSLSLSLLRVDDEVLLDGSAESLIDREVGHIDIRDEHREQGPTREE